MSITLSCAPTLALFCRVVDNYGDIGICWRFARQLQREHGDAVSLWVDDLLSFARICPQLDPCSDEQEIAGVRIVAWRDQTGTYTAAEVADIVVEFFACDIPPDYIRAMAARTVRPVWINFEGLTAQSWVEGCHTLPSPHPRLPLTKHFFFPGFNAATGGLLREADLAARRQAFLADPAAVAAFFGQWGLTPAERAAFKVSLFSYQEAPVAALLTAWQQQAQPITCIVPAGVAEAALTAFLGEPVQSGQRYTRAALTLYIVPFMPQDDYDRLLWACDFNFVRGEDSFVRAQWAGKAFIWHIYPQDEALHHRKLQAFLQIHDGAGKHLRAASLAWNALPSSVTDWATLWPALMQELPEIEACAQVWEQKMLENGDFSSNLLRFTAGLAAVNAAAAQI